MANTTWMLRNITFNMYLKKTQGATKCIEYILWESFTQGGRKLNPPLSLGCMLTLTPLEKALSAKLSDGSRVSKGIEEEVFTTNMNCSTHQTTGHQGSRTPKAPIQPERVSKQHSYPWPQHPDLRQLGHLPQRWKDRTHRLDPCSFQLSIWMHWTPNIRCYAISKECGFSLEQPPSRLLCARVLQLGLLVCCDEWTACTPQTNSSSDSLTPAFSLLFLTPSFIWK